MQGDMANRFDWKLVIAVTSLGLVFAVLTISGSLPGVGATKWTALGLLAVAGAIVGLRTSGRPFRHGLVGGFLLGLVAIEAQALFFSTYLANNPQTADLEMPFGWPPRLVTAVLGPLNAVLAAMITGAVAWIFWRARAGRSS